MSRLLNNWQSTTSGELCEYITSGSRDWKSFYSDQGPLFIRTQDINQDRLDLSKVAHVELPAKVEGKRSRIQSGDLLVTITGANVGKVALVPDEIPEAYVSQSVGLMRLKDKRHGRYLHYYLQSDQTGRKQILNLVYGIGRPVLSLQNLRDIPVALPSLPEQRRIVAEIEEQFTRLEAGVAALRRVQANLKRYRAAVLKAACEGCLVPTEAELHRKLKIQNSKFETGAQLLTRILTERRQNWQGRGKYKEAAAPDTANLPQLPEVWTWASIDQLAAETMIGLDRGRAQQNDDPASGVPYIKMNNVTMNGRVVCDEMAFVPADKGESERFAVKDRDILFNTRNSKELVGKVGIVRNAPDGAIYNNNLMRIRVPRGIVPEFLCLQMCSHGFRRRMELVKKATTNVAAVYQKDLLPLAIALPPLAEQTRIVAEVERRLSMVEELESVVAANLQRATRLRQSILQKAFTGELVKPEPSVDIAKIIPPLKREHINRPNSHFARALLSAEIVHRLHIEPTFGRIKHQKIFHLCEHIARIEEIHGQYHREAAGPLDNKLIYANEAELKKQKWYQEVRRDSYGHAYRALDKAGGHRQYVERYWADKLPTIEKLIELMRKWDTDQCEIFCTAYAAWNDLILWGKQATEDSILHEILERWHDSKKRFSKERWLRAIAWMKKEGFVPAGFGKPTKEAK